MFNSAPFGKLFNFVLLEFKTSHDYVCLILFANKIKVNSEAFTGRVV